MRVTAFGPMGTRFQTQVELGVITYEALDQISKIDVCAPDYAWEVRRETSVSMFIPIIFDNHPRNTAGLFYSYFHDENETAIGSIIGTVTETPYTPSRYKVTTPRDTAVYLNMLSIDRYNERIASYRFNLVAVASVQTLNVLGLAFGFNWANLVLVGVYQLWLYVLARRYDNLKYIRDRLRKKFI